MAPPGTVPSGDIYPTDRKDISTDDIPARYEGAVTSDLSSYKRVNTAESGDEHRNQGHTSSMAAEVCIEMIQIGKPV